MMPSDRLFVPLSAKPYNWFRYGQKKWELRKYGRQYTEKHVRPGRRVELRKGYSDPNNSLWGTILSVEVHENLDSFFDHVPYQEVIPTAKNQMEAIAEAQRILQLDSDELEPVLGFQVALEN
jgi:hypothetical protein